MLFSLQELKISSSDGIRFILLGILQEDFLASVSQHLRTEDTELGLNPIYLAWYLAGTLSCFSIPAFENWRYRARIESGLSCLVSCRNTFPSLVSLRSANRQQYDKTVDFRVVLCEQWLGEGGLCTALIGSGLGQVAGFCEHGSEPSGSIKGRGVYWALNYCQFLKASTPWGYSFKCFVTPVYTSLCKLVTGTVEIFRVRFQMRLSTQLDADLDLSLERQCLQQVASSERTWWYHKKTTLSDAKMKWCSKVDLSWRGFAGFPLRGDRDTRNAGLPFNMCDVVIWIFPQFHHDNGQNV
jgi:hypothetical protein